MRIVLLIVFLIFGLWVMSQSGSRNSPAPTAPAAGHSAPSVEKFRLLHTIGNDEKVVAQGLSRAECEQRLGDLKATSTRLGTFNEATGYGSIACLPESAF